MKKMPKELIKECVNSQKFTSTADIIEAMKEMFAGNISYRRLVVLDVLLTDCQSRFITVNTPAERYIFIRKIFGNLFSRLRL